jgi:hypothetical protein
MQITELQVRKDDLSRSHIVRRVGGPLRSDEILV